MIKQTPFQLILKDDQDVEKVTKNIDLILDNCINLNDVDISDILHLQAPNEDYQPVNHDIYYTNLDSYYIK